MSLEDANKMLTQLQSGPVKCVLQRPEPARMLPERETGTVPDGARDQVHGHVLHQSIMSFRRFLISSGSTFTPRIRRILLPHGLESPLERPLASR